MRGLFTAGLYRQMGLEDLISSNPAAYVEFAVLLGTDLEERTRQEERIKHCSSLIFNNTQTVDSPQRFFAQALDAASNGLKLSSRSWLR